MILTRKDLKNYIIADRSRYKLRNLPKIVEIFLSWILCDESRYVLKYLKTLRYLEYYTNKKKRIWDFVFYVYYFIKHRRLSYKYRIQISPNVVGPGLYIPHLTHGIILNCLAMGANCTVNTGVIVGNKNSQENRAVIGDEVELAIGCKVIGKVNIGNRVIVAPNSVVVKDVPYDCVVSGIPAVIIKQGNEMQKELFC